MIKLVLLAGCFLMSTSIYTLQFTNNQGATVSFNQYQGKKLLLVNIATGSSKVAQLQQLQQLHLQFGDSLAIIAFPSNSFGNEPRDNTGIASFCQSIYNTGFTIAAKGEVKGLSAIPIYQWLSDLQQNGALQGPVVGDFQKYLVNQQGQLIGVFDPSVIPTDSIIINAITENY